MLFKCLEIPIFNRSLLFAGDCDPSEAEAAFYDHAGKRSIISIADCDGRCTLHHGDVFVYVKDLDNCSIMFHEIVHAATFIMEASGIALNNHTDEVQAYLVGWLKLNLLDPVYEERANVEELKISMQNLPNMQND